jgi:PleD family two-component response regulator
MQQKIISSTSSLGIPQDVQVLTTSARPDSEAKFIDANRGFDKKFTFLLKPVDLDDLYDYIDNINLKEGSTILIVDDTESNRTKLKMTLEGLGFEAITAEDPVDALEQAQNLSISPSLIITDFNMPKMDGAEFLSKIRQQN